MKKDIALMLITIVIFVLVSILMLTLYNRYILPCTKERFIGGAPTFEYATQKWMRPRRNKFIARFNQLMVHTGWMTITFWVHIDKVTPYWRNIFHISQNSTMEWNDTGNAANMPYDQTQDFIRRPAVFITPNSYGIHICADTAMSNNNPFNVMHPDKCMIGLVWRTDNGKASCACYVNEELRTVFAYNAHLLQPDSDALLYFCDRFYGEGDFSVRDLKFFNKPLTQEEYLDVYESTKGQLNTNIPATGTKDIILSHPNQMTWKNNGNAIRLKSGNEMKVNILEDAKVYNSGIGRVGLLQNGDQNLAVRHSGYNMYTHPFTEGNYDFAWFFIKAGDGVYIYNDFDGGHFVGYDDKSDSVLIVKSADPRKTIWYMKPMPSIEYIN